MSGNICRCGTYTRIRTRDQGRRRHEGRSVHEPCARLCRARRAVEAAPAPAAARFLQGRAARRPGARASACPASASRPTSRRSTAATACRTACATARRSSSRSRPTAPSASSSTAPRWARACAPACRMIVADELEADWKRVRVVQAPGDEAKYGNQDTDGSRSTRHLFDADAPLRRGSARRCSSRPRPPSGRCRSARCRRRNHEVMHKPSGRKLGYGALALAAAKLDVPAPASLKLKDPSQFRYIGKTDTDPHRRAGHRHRQVAVRHRHAPARHAVRRDRAAAGARRQGQELRRRRGAEGARRGQGVRDRRHAAAFGVPAARRRRRRRQGHLGGDQGPQAAQDRLGRRRARELRLGRLPRASSRPRC